MLSFDSFSPFYLDIQITLYYISFRKIIVMYHCYLFQTPVFHDNFICVSIYNQTTDIALYIQYVLIYRSEYF